MKTNRASALSMVLLLVIPTLVVLAPSAAAQDQVPEAEGDTPVYFDGVETTTKLWLRDVSSERDADRRHGLAPVQPPRFDQQGGDDDTNYGDDFPRPRTKVYQTIPTQAGTPPNEDDLANAPAGSKAIFTFDPYDSGAHSQGLRHATTIREPNAAWVEVYVLSTLQLTYQVDLYDEAPDGGLVHVASSGGVTPVDGPSATSPDVVQANLDFLSEIGSQHTFGVNHKIVVQIVAFQQTNIDEGNSLLTGTWTLYYDEKDQTPSRLELITQDALRIAAWTQNRVSDSRDEEEVTTLFRNWTNRENYQDLVNRNKYIHVVDGWFVAESAFGLADAQNLKPPTAEIVKDGEPIDLKPWRSTCERAAVDQVPMTEVGSGDDGAGKRVWRFQRIGDEGADPCLARDWWHYNYTVDGIPAGGSYHLILDSFYDQSRSPNTGTGARITDSFRFDISSVEVSIEPFSYVEEATGTTISETTSHRVAAGGTTTFLLALTNGGSSNDTMDVAVTRVNENPLDAGFTVEPLIARVGSVEQVGASLFRLGPGNTTILTLTVRAPDHNDASATYRVTARSTLDPNADQGESTTVLDVRTFDPANPPNIRGTGILRTSAIIDVPQASQRDASVFVWNRGVVATDINVNLTRPDGPDSWNATLVDAGRVTENVVARQVPPGGISGVTVRFTASTVASDDYTVTVRAGLADGSASVVLRDLTGRARIIEAFGFDILEGIGGNLHFVEVTLGGEDGALDPDYVHGAYYRLWITNNQQGPRDFILRETVTESPGRGPNDQMTTAQAWQVVFGYRTPAGIWKTLDGNIVRVDSGRTLEVYAWVRHEPDSNERAQEPEQTADITFTVVDQATLTPRTKTVRVQVEAGTGLAERQVGALIEPVQRVPVDPSDPDSKAYVDISEEKTRRSVRHIDGDGFATYRFRVTNGASWWYFTDNTVGSQQTWDHRLEMNLLNVDTDEGWSAFWRAEGDPADTITSCDDGDLQNTDLWYPAEEWVSYPPLDPDTGMPVLGANGREAFWDAEVEVVVCPPAAGSSNRPVAGEAEEIIFQVRQDGPGQAESSDYRTLETVIGAVPDVTITPRFPTDAERFVTQQDGGEAIIPVFIANNGSYLTNVTLRAELEGSGWFMTGNSVLNITPLKAFENRTVTFRVKSPQGGASSATLTFTADYLRNLYDPSSEQLSTGPVPATVVSTAFTPTFDMEFVPGGSSQCAGSTTAVTCTAQLPDGNNDDLKTVAVPLNLTNNGASSLNLRLTSPTMPGWTFASPEGGNKYSYSTTLSLQGTGSGANTDTRTILVKPPRDAVAGSVTDLVITAYDPSQEENTRTLVATVVVAGGVLTTDIRVERSREFVERDNTVSFPITIRNDGNVDGTIRLTSDILDITRVQGINDPRLCALGNANCWRAWIESVGDTQLVDVNGTSRIFTPEMRATTATYFLVKGEALRVNLTMYAPFFEQENAHARASLTLRNASNLNQQLGSVTVTGEIQDYGVDAEPTVDQLTLLPGLGGTVRVFITNTGDANDTVNLSVDTGGLPWDWRFSSDEVFLTPGTTTSVLLTVQTPVDPLPSPRTAKLFVYMGTRGGQEVNVSRYDIEPLFVTVPPYRQLDVDNDNITELAVDKNRDLTDGYETFIEYSDLVRLTRTVESPKGPDGKVKHFLDIPPTGGTYDGIADVYWDPDQNFMTRITITFDLDREGSPDYLLDSDGDGVIDTAYQSATRQFLSAEAVHILSDKSATQYLIDQTGDGKPNRYYDPASETLSRVVAAPDLGENMYGIDTDNDGDVDRYYNTRTKVSTPAESVNLVDLAGQYWYLFAGFLAVVVLFGVVLIRRRAV